MDTQLQLVTRDDLLTLFPAFSYKFWVKAPRDLLPCVRDGKSYVYDLADVRAYLGVLKTRSLNELVKDQPQPRRRGRPRKVAVDAAAAL